MAYRIMTPENFVFFQVDKYPSMYADHDLQTVKLRVFDQLFNVTGNGVRDDDELIDMVKYRRNVAKGRPFNRDRAIGICKGTPVYHGYTEVEDLGEGMMIGRGNSITVVDDERDQHPEVRLWRKVMRQSEREKALGTEPAGWTPYPNFSKQYSTTWNTNVKALGPEWCEAVVWFYTKCQEYFAGDHKFYHNRYPSAFPAQDAKLIEDMLRYREKYKSDKEFSDMYLGSGAVYNGDMDAFLQQRWARTKIQIDGFLIETIAEYS